MTRDNRRFDAIAEQIQRKAERLLLSKKVKMNMTTMEMCLVKYVCALFVTIKRILNISENVIMQFFISVTNHIEIYCSIEWSKTFTSQVCIQYIIYTKLSFFRFAKVINLTKVPSSLL